MLKRAFDIFLSFFGILISSPLWLIIACAIRAQGGEPIFFEQERVGKDGRIFKGLKFRSMVKNADAGSGPLQAEEHDARVTRIGAILRVTAMDELPQLVNILQGDMSFVGPRALRPVEIEEGDTIPRSVWEFPGFKDRSSVVPGLTGIAQLIAQRNISRTEKFKYDMWYIRNRSFWLDLYLIVLSFFVTFFGRWETRGLKIAPIENLSKRVQKDIEGDAYRSYV